MQLAEKMDLEKRIEREAMRGNIHVLCFALLLIL